MLDTLVQSPVALETLVHGITAQPQAAAVLIQLLRVTETMAMEAALVVESLAYGLLQGSEGHARWFNSPRAVVVVQPSGQISMERSQSELIIRMDRPKSQNAIDRHMRDGLQEAFELAAVDDEIAHIRLLGQGKAFSVGADLSEFGTTRDPVTAHQFRMQTLPAHAIARCRDRLEAHVQGACIGSGLEMAAFARRLTASANAWFQLPELAMGILPGAGGCVSIPRRIGRQRAALMMLSGRRISARTALKWGLIDAIVDD
ncbi:MAG: enoyl-CoA hydratase/isomerase family protein [Sphingobium sp.]